MTHCADSEQIWFKILMVFIIFLQGPAGPKGDTGEPGLPGFAVKVKLNVQQLKLDTLHCLGLAVIHWSVLRVRKVSQA